MLVFNKIIKLLTKFNTDIFTERWKPVMRCKVSRKTEATYKRDCGQSPIKCKSLGDKLCKIEWTVFSSTKILHIIVFRQIGNRGNSSL